MGSKFNIAMLPYCPAIVALKAAFEAFAGSEKFIITEIDVQSSVIYATLNVDTDKSIKAINRDDKSMGSQTVTETKAYPFRIESLDGDRGVLQTFAGGASVFKIFEAFFEECISDDTTMTIKEIDIQPLKLWETIFERTKTEVKDKKGRTKEVVAKIVKAKFSNYEARGDVTGAFNASFKDSGEAREFISTFMSNFKSMTVEYGHKKDRVRVTYGLNPHFSIAAGADVGEQDVQWLLEDMVIVPVVAPTTEEVPA